MRSPTTVVLLVVTITTVVLVVTNTAVLIGVLRWIHVFSNCWIHVTRTHSTTKRSISVPKNMKRRRKGEFLRKEDIVIIVKKRRTRNGKILQREKFRRDVEIIWYKAGGGRFSVEERQKKRQQLIQEIGVRDEEVEK